MASIKRLSFGLPGTIAGPVSPPAIIAARESARKPPLGSLVLLLWHSEQRFTRIGRTSFSKNSISSEENSPADSSAPRLTDAMPTSRQLISNCMQEMPGVNRRDIRRRLQKEAGTRV